MFVQKINNIKSQNSNSKNEIFLNPISLNKISNKDTFSRNDISFKAYHGYSWYGTQADKDALKYKLILTPEKISKEIHNIHDIYDAGIMNIKIYKAFIKDTEGVSFAHTAMSNIINKLSKEGTKCIKEASSMGTNTLVQKIPGVNIIAPAINVSRATNKISDLYEDIHGIVENFWVSGLKSINDQRYISTRFALTTIGSVEKESGNTYNPNVRKIHANAGVILNEIKNSSRKQDSQYSTINSRFNKTLGKLCEASLSMLHTKESVALKGMIKKIVLLGLDLGISDGIVDNISDSVNLDSISDIPSNTFLDDDDDDDDLCSWDGINLDGIDLDDL